MSRLIRLVATGASAVALLLVACGDQEPTSPEGRGDELLAAKPGQPLRVTPPQLAFTAIGEVQGITAASTASGTITAEVSSPACVSVELRRAARSSTKFDVTATGAGACTITVADGTNQVQVPVTVTIPDQPSIVSIVLESTSIQLEGAGPSYTATLQNGGAPLAATILQGQVFQDGSDRAAGGIAFTLETGTTTVDFAVSVSNTTPGLGTLVAGPAILVMDLIIGGTFVADSDTFDVTLTN